MVQVRLHLSGELNLPNSLRLALILLALCKACTIDGKMEMVLNRWIDDWQFYVLFNRISVISGRWADDNERLCAMEPHLGLKRPSPHARLKLKNARSVSQGSTH